MNHYYYQLDVGKEAFVKQYIHEINIYRFNWHKEIEIIWMMNGKADVCVEGQNYEMETDDILIIHSNRGHASMLRQLDSMAMVLHIAPEIFADSYDDYGNIIFHGDSDNQTRYESRFTTIRTCLAKMMVLSQQETAGNDMAARGNLYLLLASLIEHFTSQKERDYEDQKALKDQRNLHGIMKYTEKNYYRQIKLEEIARLANYNRTYVSTFFKLHTGINYYEYLSRVRLRKAVHQLNTTDKNITNIALDNGFPNIKSFSMYFKKYFQMPPKEYKVLVEQRSGPVFNELERRYIPFPHPVIEDKLNEYRKLPSTSDTGRGEKRKEAFANTRELKKLCEEMLELLNDI